MNKDEDNKDPLVIKLYEEEIDLISENGEKWPVPVDGSLGLLALGYKGIIAWRKVRQKFEEKEHE